jgi:catechol 2,3-dioxygenase-like lactoylglutathione lyase family enzyme
MMYRMTVVAMALGVVVALGTQEAASTQGGELAMSRVSHVGVVVADMDAALREYVRVMGFHDPKAYSYPVPAPDGTTLEFKTATLYMPNFFIEVIQPQKPAGPYYERLQSHGMGIQHVGLALAGTGSVDDLRRGWEQQGGKWTLGPAGAAYAYVDFQSTLGTSLELNRGGTAGPGEKALTLPAGDALPPLAALPVTHVGFAAADTAAVLNSFGKLFGITPPKIIEYRDAQYPPNAAWSTTAFLRLAMFNQGGMGVEVIESVGGPTPWSEYVKQQKGTAAQHIAINVGNRMDEMIRDLVAKGGTWTNGKPGGSYAYLDFSKTLGLIFELNGTAKSAGAK